MEAIDILFGFIWKSGLFIGLALIGVLLLLYFYQNKLLYIPDSPNRLPRDNPEGLRDPKEAGLISEDVTITTKDKIKLHGWLVKTQHPERNATIVYFHENAGNIGTRIPFMKYFQKFCGVNILLVAYRGYSYSEGIPTEIGLQRDAQAVLRFIFERTDIDTDRIFVFGRSLGGAVGINCLSNGEFPVTGLMLENTFTSISDMVDIVFAKLAPLKRLVLRVYWHSLESIRTVKTPILFVMGLKDELIPSTQMQKLYQGAEKCPFKEQYEVHEGTHNDTWARNVEEYFATINSFMDRCQKHKNKSSSAY